MMISTKGRYALRVMIDLAEHNTGEYMPLKELSQRLDISMKYLESILTVLSKASYVDAVRGKGGGYRLAKPPELYTAAGIIQLSEGSLSPVSCLAGDSVGCERAAECRTLPLWRSLDKVICDYLESVTLADLLRPDFGEDA